MANYYATARSNYVRLKDPDAVRQLLADRAGEVTLCESHLASGCFAFLVSGMSDSGCWPGIYPVDPDGQVDYDSEPEDFADVIAPHLADGEVLILMEAGAEKLRYIGGWARAVRVNRGRIQNLNISLDDIYALVERRWKVKPTEAVR